MAGKSFLAVHRTWEDWLGIGLGCLIAISPWIAGETGTWAVTLNAVLVGVVIVCLAAFELVDLRRWEEIGAFLVGLWLIASPYVLGYSGALRIWHLVLGAAVVVLAMVEYWQDWSLSEDELARRGR
jgi:hypothetical protein